MDLFTLPGYGGKKRSSDSQPDSFQRELKAKMKERNKRGLSVEITPSASERETEDELGSEDELMVHFNMTSKHQAKKTTPSWKSKDRTSPSSSRSKSPHDRHTPSPFDTLLERKTPNSLYNDGESDDDSDDDFDHPTDLMMTMKKPMKPMDFTRRDASKTMPSLRKSKALMSVNEDELSDEKRWTPPSAKKHRNEKKENEPLRPKSPNIRGRKATTGLMDCIEEEIKPKPSPRIKRKDASESLSRPVPKPRVLSPKLQLSEEESENEDIMTLPSTRSKPAQRPSFLKKSKSDTKTDGGRRTPSDGRKTPLEGRRTPSDGRRTPDDDRRTPLEGRRTPSDGRRTPDDRKTSFEGRRTPSDGRRTPDGRKIPLERSRTPSDGRKTPSDGQKTPEMKRALFGRKSSSDMISGRKTPTGEVKTGTGKKISFDQDQTSSNEGSPKVQKKSVMDMFSASSKESHKPKGRKKKGSTLLADSESDSDVGIGAPRQSPPMLTKQRAADSQSAPRRNRHRSGAADGREHDEIDGFRMLPPESGNRESPTYRRPSLRNKSLSPSDHLQKDERCNNIRKPSLRQNDSMDDETSGYGRQSRDHDRSRSTDRTCRMAGQDDRPERESSVCRDVDKDPTLAKEKELNKERKLSKTYTTNGRILEDAITSVDDAQENRMKYIDPDKENTETKETTKKIPRHCPKPRYAKPIIDSTASPNLSSLSFNSTADIRNAVYQEWYKIHLEQAKKELKKKKEQEKELEKKLIKEKEDKILEAKASYQAWLENKKESLEKERRERKQKEEEEARQKKEAENKRKEAEATFKMWKERKDEYLRKEFHRKQQEEERKRKEEKNKIKKKKRYDDPERVFEEWKQRKDDKIKTIKMTEKKTKKEKEEEERREQEKREREAQDSYLKWIEKKEKQLAKKTQSKLSEDGQRRAWFPPSPTVHLTR